MAEDQEQDNANKSGLKVISVQRFEAPAPSNALVDPENTFATTKEEEWVTKKKVELTTKRQIETRVKRQVVLEDGKVVEDSGPIVTTNTTEDTEKQESKQTEHRQLGDKRGEDENPSEWVAIPGPDGLVKEVRERNVRSREEKEERLETEDVQHFGDISDDAYQNAIQSLEPDLRLVLQRSRGQELKEANGSPRIVHQSCKSKKIVDTEDSQKLSAVQQDGRIITETRKTTEREVVNNEEVPDDKSGSEDAHEEHKESQEHYKKSKDQELVEYLADGVKIGKEMRYQAENVEGGRHGDQMDSQHSDSLANFIRKARKHRTMVAPDGTTLIDRKDALTKRPLDYDQEEETRKVETSKWLENHFGSESQSSKGSIDDEDIRPSGTSTSFINVTMKSTNHMSSPVIENNNSSVPKIYNATTNTSSRVFVSSPESNANSSPPPPKTSYFQGISEWKSEKENISNVKSSFSPPLRERVQVLPTGPNHTFNKSPSPPFNNQPQSPTKIIQNGSPGRESPSLHRTERYTYNRYYERNESPSCERNSSPLYSGIRSSPYDKSASPYTSKNHLNGNGNGKLSSEEERRSVSPVPRRKYNGHNGHHIEGEDESSTFIRRERENWQVPAPDYFPPRETPSPPEIRSTPPPEASKKKIYQRTRFAADIPPVKPKPQAQQSSGGKSGGGIGHSFRKLVGRLRSSSSERKKEKKKHLERADHEFDGDHSRGQRGDMPIQRYYLGEDPFGGSIYGREKEYRGAQPPPRRPARRGYDSQDDRNHVTSSSTLGRLSKSTSRLAPDRTPHTINHVIDYTDRGGIQTLPRKLHNGEHRFKKSVSAQSSLSPQQTWESQRYSKYSSSHSSGLLNGHANNSNSTINVSIVNKTTPPSSSLGMSRPPASPTTPPITGPAKPARTYRSSLLRSKSFNVHAGDNSLRDFNSVYKSNPQLHRLDEDPAPLKSPGIVTSISRSTKDLNEAVENSERDHFKKSYNNYDNNRFSKSTSHLNGYTNSRISTHETKKKIFMKGLMDRAPELYKTLHGNDTDDSRKSSPIHEEHNGKLYTTSTPIRNGHRVVEYSSSFRSSNTSSPLVNGDRVSSPTYTTSITHTPSFRKSNGEVTNRSVVRRGSNDDYSETVRITSKSDDPLRPSVTNTVQSFTKKTVPTKNGTATETIQSKETKTVTKSRYRGGDTDLKYLENNNKYSNRNGGVVIEVRNNK